MTERKRALTDLRPVAEQQLFADWRVTPELKAKLYKRIDAKTTVATPKRRPWLRWSGGLAVAAAAVVALAVIGRNPVLTTDSAPVARGTEQATAPTQLPTVDADKFLADQNGNTMNKATATTAPAVATKATLTSAPETVTAQVFDAAGQSVTVQHSQSFTLKSLNAPEALTIAGAPQVAGVEAQPGRKVILNAEYQLQVKDAVAAMQRFQTLAATTAGYVVDAQLNKGGDGSWAGRLTLRLPAGQYNGAISEIRQIGEVMQERQWSQDVTERYYDLEARIRIQQEYERKLQELAGKAATFDDWMKLTQQINSTRALIEQMQGSIKLLGNQVEYSTINIAFVQPAPGQAPPPKPPEPAKGLGPAMARSFQASVQWFADLGQALLVGAAAIAPFLVALGVLALVALLGWRRFQARKSG